MKLQRLLSRSLFLQKEACFRDGSFFPTISLTKKYIYLKYAIDTDNTKDLNRLLKRDSYNHEEEAQTFTFEELERFIGRGDQDPREIQTSLIAIISFFCLARSVEVISVLDSYLGEFNEKDGSFIVELYRCSKSRSFKKTKVYIPLDSLFNSAVHMKQHLNRIPKTQRVRIPKGGVGGRFGDGTLCVEGGL